MPRSAKLTNAAMVSQGNNNIAKRDKMQGANHTQRKRLMSILGSRLRNQRSSLGPQLWLMSWQVNAYF